MDKVMRISAAKAWENKLYRCIYNAFARLPNARSHYSTPKSLELIVVITRSGRSEARDPAFRNTVIEPVALELG
ncbi:hypothetical protein MTO96_020767 [Rhipicephalus appendiculatus]